MSRGAGVPAVCCGQQPRRPADPADPADFEAHVFPLLFLKGISALGIPSVAEAVADFGDDVIAEKKRDITRPRAERL